MDFLEKLDASIKIPNVQYHRFMTSYKKKSSDIYVFCEGDVDLGYYCEQISRICPEIELQKYVAEGKNNVLQIWQFINWDDYQKNRVLFFVDRDLSYWADEPQEYDSNVYVTDGYSFENDAVNPHMFIKLLEDLYGFANATSMEKRNILDLYLEKWEAFKEGSYELMGYILYKYQFSHKHTASKLKVRNCLDIGNVNIWKKTIKNLSYTEFIKCKLEIDNEDITEILERYKKRFTSEESHYSIRGKWCLDFMICLMEYVLVRGRDYAPSLYNGITKEPDRLVQLTDRGAMAIIAPKIIPPQSLKAFLCANVGSNDI